MRSSGELSVSGMLGITLSIVIHFLCTLVQPSAAVYTTPRSCSSPGRSLPVHCGVEMDRSCTRLSINMLIVARDAGCSTSSILAADTTAVVIGKEAGFQTTNFDSRFMKNVEGGWYGTSAPPVPCRPKVGALRRPTTLLIKDFFLNMTSPETCLGESQLTEGKTTEPTTAAARVFVGSGTALVAHGGVHRFVPDAEADLVVGLVNGTIDSGVIGANSRCEPLWPLLERYALQRVLQLQLSTKRTTLDAFLREHLNLTLTPHDRGHGEYVGEITSLGVRVRALSIVQDLRRGSNRPGADGATATVDEPIVYRAFADNHTEYDKSLDWLQRQRLLFARADFDAIERPGTPRQDRVEQMLTEWNSTKLPEHLPKHLWPSVAGIPRRSAALPRLSEGLVCYFDATFSFVSILLNALTFVYLADVCEEIYVSVYDEEIYLFLQRIQGIKIIYYSDLEFYDAEAEAENIIMTTCRHNYLKHLSIQRTHTQLEFMLSNRKVGMVDIDAVWLDWKWALETLDGPASSLITADLAVEAFAVNMSMTWKRFFRPFLYDELGRSDGYMNMLSINSGISFFKPTMASQMLWKVTYHKTVAYSLRCIAGAGQIATTDLYSEYQLRFPADQEFQGRVDTWSANVDLIDDIVVVTAAVAKTEVFRPSVHVAIHCIGCGPEHKCGIIGKTQCMQIYNIYAIRDDWSEAVSEIMNITGAAAQLSLPSVLRRVVNTSAVLEPALIDTFVRSLEE